MSTYNYNPYAYYYNNGIAPIQPQPQVSYNNNILSGRLVENIDVAKTAEVPVGSYGVFPKSDLSEVYIKIWNPNGTTDVLTYQLIKDQQPISPEESFSQINDKLNELNKKIDTLM